MMRFVYSVVLLFAVVGCSAADPSANGKPGPGDDNNDSHDDVMLSDTGTHDVAGIDGGDEADGATPDFGEIPGAITSAGAEFSGRLPAGGSVALDFSVFQSDRVTMWLRQTNSTSWDPSINVLRDGMAEPVVWGNPRGNTDASIPFRAGELEDGYEFWFTDTYTLQLENRGDTDGDFVFTLECRGGPCGIESGDADIDGVPDDVDDCPYRPGRCDEDPYPGLTGAALEDAIRADHTDHVTMNYVEARVHMFAWIDKVSGQIECIYTGDRVTTDEIPDAAEMNTEHGWPRGRGGDAPAAESDLHHLYPTRPDANTERAALYYGEVTSNPDWQRGGSSRGRNANGDTVFEPRDALKGDLARTLFYYAVIYDIDMRAEEEATLRAWNVADPPDERELRRHQSIANVQRSRNPFVDYPALADRITTF